MKSVVVLVSRFAVAVLVIVALPDLGCRGLGREGLSPVQQAAPTSTVSQSAKTATGGVGTSFYANETVSVTMETPAAFVLPQTQPARQLSSLANLTASQVNALLATNSIVLVDARSRSAYQAGHIPGAVSFPFGASTEQDESFVSEYPPATALVVYCDGSDCDVAGLLAEKLIRKYGYVNVRRMPGGLAEWKVFAVPPAGGQATTAPAEAP